MSDIYDLAIIGSGFAGSLLAMIAHRLGRSVVLLERGNHPRMAIGESSTPLSNLLLEELATRYDLPVLLPLTKWGAWQQQHPEIACGLKRGFSFFHHELGDAGNLRFDKQMLVAASPHNKIADTHWYRADLDHHLVREAQCLGVGYHDEVNLQQCTDTGEYVELTGEHHQQAVKFRARFVIDATGPRGCLHRLLNLPEAELPHMPATQALYSHFSNVKRLDEAASFNTGTPPYPVDDAAVHHIFDGGWIWVLRFNNGITSAGIAATEHAAQRLGLPEKAPAWQQLLDHLPALREQFAEAIALQPFTYMARLGFRSGAITGARWALLPSAAGFVDPLLSSGFPLTLLGISRMAKIIDQHWSQPTFATELLTYAASTDGELLATAHLIGTLYANMHNFDAFRAISLLYFAAASFSETARRLGKLHLAQSFLLHADPRFGPAAAALLDRAARGISTNDTATFVQDVQRAIGPFDVAGLCTAPRNNWYPVKAEDLKQSAWKVEATTQEIDDMLQRSGFYML
ncbi:NAD(P)/FAD-dependent oxidoreductase [Granulicella arctica]|uniref:FADH2 O2-dependent halogenase n=1 Tax=Granulicella arctica TaxID=940613 RepID=A0A7Y9TJA8_9BACT|nr:FAD-dependent oxidoreductase [Granulicella arctica]NYF78087.1 FADH2 O2-dependent halogenase [Granulicella arctica]